MSGGWRSGCVCNGGTRLWRTRLVKAIQRSPSASGRSRKFGVRMLKQNHHPCCLLSAKRPYYCPFLCRRFSSRLRFQTSLGQAPDTSLLFLLLLHWSQMASAAQRPSKQAKEDGSCSIQHLFAAREREFPSFSSTTTATSSPPREPRHTPTLPLSERLLSHGFWTRPVLLLLSGRCYSAQLSLSDSPQARGGKRKSHNGFSCPVAFSLGAASSIRKAAAP